MEFNDYQQTAFRTADYPDMGRNPYYPALGLGEAGEVQGKVKKIMRDDGGVITDAKRQAIRDELGDVLWYVAVLAIEMGLTLDEIAAANVQKLQDRKDRGVIKGSGDYR